VRAALLIALLTGCLAPSDDDPGKVDQPSTIYTGDVAAIDFGAEAERGTAPDLCDLATELPRDNACSLLCDPERFAARLVDDGMSGGRCYQLRCELPGTTVSVGICIP
jgi:hypothetical protein